MVFIRRLVLFSFIQHVQEKKVFQMSMLIFHDDKRHATINTRQSVSSVLHPISTLKPQVRSDSFMGQPHGV